MQRDPNHYPVQQGSKAGCTVFLAFCPLPSASCLSTGSFTDVTFESSQQKIWKVANAIGSIATTFNQ
ncbi:MAG TPA: hypothetical protein V6C85_13130 [Allocoleopsis sp.]